MPLRQSPTFKETELKTLEIPQPAIKGLNLNDLEYEQDVNQSPYLINMMYKNGIFSKRYGQSILHEYDEKVYSYIYYKDYLFVHRGDKIYRDDEEILSGVAEKSGLFIHFSQKLYYLCDDFYEYDGEYFSTLDPYIPVIVINRKPDGTSGDTSEAYNMVGTGYQVNFHGDNSSTTYQMIGTNLDRRVPKVLVDNEEWTYDENLVANKTFKINYETGVVTFKSAPPTGTNNVEITVYKTDQEWLGYHDQLVNSKFYSCFGGNNNSRLFLAGGGKSTYYYSDVYDASYFPYTNYAVVGNSVDDITGFGQQYNVLIIFKPTEIYSLTYYVATSDDTTEESQIGIGAFSSTIVNNRMGCDCPNTIQLINNQLTWFSTKDGVCTLVSTNIIDERNIRVISTNIERTNNFGARGILDIDLNENQSPIYDTIISADFENKYFVIFPYEYKNNEIIDCGLCYVWDYEISPYVVTSSRTTAAKDLSWFLFDSFYFEKVERIKNKLGFISSKDEFNTNICILDKTLSDLDYDGDDIEDPIVSKYYTPLNQFNAVEYLKTIKNIYVQCRGDKPTTIYIKYITEDSPNGEDEPEPIHIYANIFDGFNWENFGWEVLNFTNTFRRKCSIKKTQVMGIEFYNNINNCDMSISHLAFQYQVVKYIK